MIELTTNWIIRLPGLVRVPFFDPADRTSGYVVFYSEVERAYGIVKYCLADGSVIWENTVVNGGYGTPVVWGNCIVVLKGFSDIVAFDKRDGTELWELHTKHRIRSSPNVINNRLLCSSGGDLLQIDKDGNIASDFNIEGVFFFGTISIRHDHFIAVGTKYDREHNASRMHLFGLDSDGDVLFETDLGDSSVISTDTSGFWYDDEYVYVNCDDKIYRIDSNNGNIVWTQSVNGICGRHIPIVDDTRLYYTTLRGNIGCLDKKDGKKIWEVGTQEGCIVAPPSLYGSSLLVLADSSLYLMNAMDGVVYQKVAVGHCPYSACSIFDGRVYVGGGEPPVNGLFFSFNIEDIGESKQAVVRSFEVGNYVENSHMELVITVASYWDSAELDASVISPQKANMGKQLGRNVLFDVELKENCLSGYYCMPVLLSKGALVCTEAVNVHLSRREILPSKFRLNRFYKETVQDDYLYSGAALAQLVFAEYGKEISQKDFREMIDYVKTKSHWEDADFQTWRLILKRVLSNPGKNKNDLVESEKE